MKLRALQFSVGDLNLNSETYIGSGGCQILKINTVTMKKIQECYRNIKFYLRSGNDIDVITKIDR